MVELGETVMEGELSPVDQMKDEPGMEDEAEMVVELPSQMVVLVAVMFTEGVGLTVMVIWAELEHWSGEVTVTE